MKTYNPTKFFGQTGFWACTLGIAILLACSSESEDMLPPPPQTQQCEDQNVSLSQDVLPIIQQNCAVSGCHVAGTGRADFTVKANVIQNAGLIRANTQSGVMPPSGTGMSLTSQQKEAIACWVQNGAKDN